MLEKEMQEFDILLVSLYNNNTNCQETIILLCNILRSCSFV